MNTTFKFDRGPQGKQQHWILMSIEFEQHIWTLRHMTHPRSKLNRTTLSDTNWRIILKRYRGRRQISHSSAPPLQPHDCCPGAALSGHQAKLPFTVPWHTTALAFSFYSNIFDCLTFIASMASNNFFAKFQNPCRMPAPMKLRTWCRRRLAQALIGSKPRIQIMGIKTSCYSKIGITKPQLQLPMDCQPDYWRGLI